ncbi:hypothetical protein HER10_EVM0008988 [Colletotrichum scovillei]|uniref:F-box domain protein n=1 Tax=Colletotrichum scovillei TaxID=1209932 RepID=A0A9P7RET6_9PEZI|nr:uncharacterized protein HER10_EVM0008988 [Colletotrichum scovillei]KAF4780059.1 hypothetical protein HER10_EVM0008988 [Colletotrichum scovillei]KAG7057168.1 f-box domain protein [Colletotrichum scovillei]KAG7075768.1 f-box domain protein [Colletotrichum scovillei]KAG7082890.1 f-box domain protein [Colletotrichum scovillei]
MVGIAKLPPEVIQHIFDQLSTAPSYSHLYWVDASFKSKLSDLEAISRTCRAFRQLVRRNLFSYVWLVKPGHSHLISLIRGWDSRPYCTQHVRRVCIPIHAPELSPRQQEMRLSDDEVPFIEGTLSKMGLSVNPKDWNGGGHINILAIMVPLMAKSLRELEIEYILSEDHRNHDVSNKLLLMEDDVFPNLETLHIKCTPRVGRFPMELVKAISKNAPKLRSLKIQHFDDAWFDESQTWEKLTDISIWSSLNMQPFIMEIISKPKHLCHFGLDRCVSSVSQMVDMIDALTEHKETLKALSVRFPDRSTGETASLLLHKLCNLETFTTQLQDAGTRKENILRQLPKSLRKLRIVQARDHHHNHLADHCWLEEHLRRLKKTGKHRNLQVFICDTWEEKEGEEKLDFDGRDEDSIEKEYLAEAVDWMYLMP